MTNVAEAFPSEYLRAADLQGRTVKVTIDNCTMEEVGRGRDASRKIIVYFRGGKKGLALNKTNANAIAAAYGPETDEWHGGEVELFTAMVDYQGKQVEAIRVRIPTRRPAEQSESPAPPRNGPTGSAGAMPRRGALDDDIPFAPCVD